jgi:phosphodiesterase/alkaline phosphatase D-like protein
MLSIRLALLVALTIAPAAFGQQNDGYITHGPILGRPGSQSMGIWARTAKSGSFRVRYGTDAQQLKTLSPPATTTVEHDNTGWLLLEGLSPDTRYYYRVVPGDDAAVQSGPGGSFHTLPDSKVTRNEEHNPRGLFNFRFEAGSCANQGEHGLGPALPAYRTMLPHLRDKIHFAIMNGDWLYEDSRDYPAEAWLMQVGLKPDETPRVVQIAPPVAAMWQNYKVYLERGKPLAAWHREVPSYFTYDDHEIVNDVIACGEVGKRDRRTVFRDIAVQAWQDYLAWSNPTDFNQPIWFGRAALEEGSDVLVDKQADFSKLNLEKMANLHVHWGTPDAGVNDPQLDAPQLGDPNAGVYGIVEVLDRQRLRVRPAAKKDGMSSYSIGQRSYYRNRVGNCDFFYLDTRTHRSQHDIKRPDKPGVTMLGQQQKEWLMQGMAKSDADFFFVVSSVPFTIPHVDAGGMAFAAPDKDDAWTAFLDEREQLIRHWESLGKPVMVITGDLHNSFAIKLSDQVWEFCCGPHNSRNHPASAEGNRPPNGRFNSRGRECDILWSTYFLDRVPLDLRKQPVYCMVQVNNVFNNPAMPGEQHWMAYPRPQVIFQYFNGLTGEMMFAQPVLAVAQKR